MRRRGSDAPRPTRPGAWLRVIRRLLPVSFLGDWEREIEQHIAFEQAAAHTRGRLATLGFVLRTVADLIHAAWQTRPRGRWRARLRDARLSLGRAPGMTATAVLTIGLGTAVSLGMFRALHDVVWQPLPVREPATLLRVKSLLPPDAKDYPVAPADFRALASRATTLSGVTYLVPSTLDADVVLGTGDGPQRIRGLRVAPDYFDRLGVSMSLGRGFTTTDAGPAEVILSDAAWRTSYAGDVTTVGRSLTIDGRPHTVIGVLPEAFDIPHGGSLPDYWIARRLRPQESESPDFILEVIVRMAPGRTIEEAAAEIDAIGRQSARERPGTVGSRILVAEPYQDAITGQWTRPLSLLATASGLVMLMACGSVALLMLARQSARRHEVAVRLALGASRRDLVRGLVLETGVLSVLGTGLGLALAGIGAPALTAIAPAGVPRFTGVRFDATLWAFAAAAVLTTTTLAGLAPIAGLRRVDAVAALRSAPRHGRLGGRRGRAAIVLVECGLLTVLLAALGLSLVGLMRLAAHDPGFRPENRVAIEVSAPASTLRQARERLARQTQFFADLRSRLLALPGVSAAGIISNLPLTAGWGGQLFVRDHPLDPGAAPPTIEWEVAGPGYFQAAGIDMVRGREFSSQDDGEAPPVAIVSETLARQYFPDRDPIGLLVSGESPAGPFRRVVGIARDVSAADLGAAPRARLYVAQPQSFPFGKYQMVVALASGAGDVPLARAIREVDAAAVHGPPLPLHLLVRRATAGPTLAVLLIAIFAGLALLLATTTLWGVVSFVGRTHQDEWALRAALGAGRSRLTWTAAAQVLLPSSIGVAGGLVTATIAARSSPLVFGVEAIEPAVLAGVAVVVGTVIVLAGLLPARRAARVDPGRLLRGGG